MLKVPAACVALLTALVASAAEPSAADLEFFEKKIRPVLADKCYGCHSNKTSSPLGGLRLDSRDGLLRGGRSGPALLPGNPEASRIIQALSYKRDLKMPPSGRLSDSEIADFAAWVK